MSLNNTSTVEQESNNNYDENNKSIVVENEKINNDDQNCNPQKQQQQQQQCQSEEVVDLIVLGLPWDCTEEKLIKYFSKYGEVNMVDIKRDRVTLGSKGFGFIRFTNYETQIAVLKDQHRIDDRLCTVKIPFSKEEIERRSNERKIHVGGVTEATSFDDLREFFSQFGEVEDVFIPQPLRHFGFVTFKETGIASRLFGKVFNVNGFDLTIGVPTPKGSGGGGGGGGGGSGGRYHNKSSSTSSAITTSNCNNNNNNHNVIVQDRMMMDWAQQIASGDQHAFAALYSSMLASVNQQQQCVSVGISPFQGAPSSANSTQYFTPTQLNQIAAMAAAQMMVVQQQQLQQQQQQPTASFPTHAAAGGYAPYLQWNNQAWTPPPAPTQVVTTAQVQQSTTAVQQQQQSRPQPFSERNNLMHLDQSQQQQAQQQFSYSTPQGGYLTAPIIYDRNQQAQQQQQQPTVFTQAQPCGVMNMNSCYAVRYNPQQQQQPACYYGTPVAVGQGGNNIVLQTEAHLGTDSEMKP